MMEYALTLLVEQYGPVGILAAVLWYRQTAMIRALLDLAEQTSGVDASEIKDDVQPLSGNG